MCVGTAKKQNNIYSMVAVEGNKTILILTVMIINTVQLCSFTRRSRFCYISGNMRQRHILGPYQSSLFLNCAWVTNGSNARNEKPCQSSFQFMFMLPKI